MRKFLLTSRKDSRQIVYTYNDAGELVGIELLGQPSTEQRRWAFSFIPFNMPVLQKEPFSLLNISELVEDLSFDVFWERYGYKVKRQRAEEVWEKMKDADKILALLAIPRYKRHIQQRNISQAHPDRWLKDRRWLDEY